jgi:hypothetical protein
MYVKKKKVKQDDLIFNQLSNNVKTHKSMQIEVEISIGIYVSKECAEAVQVSQKKTNSKVLKFVEINNMQSSIRMISAIHGLKDCPYQRGIIFPKVNDELFQLPNGYDCSNKTSVPNFNTNQSNAIKISECMFDDKENRLHLILGPPGKKPSSNSCLLKYYFCVFFSSRHW